jgi:hypothetical protein
MKSFEERLRAIEAALRRKPGAGAFTILEIIGALPGAVSHASAGPLRFDRADGEEYPAFVERCAQAAYSAGIMLLTIGGLPDSESAICQKYTLANGEFDFPRWWDEVGGVGYSEIPPVTENYRRPTSTVTSLLDR